MRKVTVCAVPSHVIFDIDYFSPVKKDFRSCRFGNCVAFVVRVGKSFRLSVFCFLLFSTFFSICRSRFSTSLSFRFSKLILCVVRCRFACASSFIGKLLLHVRQHHFPSLNQIPKTGARLLFLILMLLYA